MKKRYNDIIVKLLTFWNYCVHGVWSDTRPLWRVNIIKTINITVRSFLNTDLQSQACAMTYRTMLAIVPALALLFAIGRGFGFQNLLQDELYKIFPSQHEAISRALAFVDSYLNQASEGIFVGVGIVFLLWTLISLISNVENVFNLLWGVKQGRSFWRKITDYTAMFLILPILMICGSGFAIFLNNTIQHFFNLPFLSPFISVLFECASYLFTCLFFTAVFMLIPNTQVKFKNAFFSGLFTGTAFIILQWLFVSGQLYVSKYNAIYGSFSFLPLLLIWMQLVWVICLTGSLICYASQNIFAYSFVEQIDNISRDYNEKVTIAITAVIIQNFIKNERPVTPEDLVMNYGIPSRLVNKIIDKLVEIDILSRVLINEKHEQIGFQPAMEPEQITLNLLRKRINQTGTKDFIPNFDNNFIGVIHTLDTLNADLVKASGDIKLSNIKITLKKTPPNKNGKKFSDIINISN